VPKKIHISPSNNPAEKARRLLKELKEEESRENRQL